MGKSTPYGSEKRIPPGSERREFEVGQRQWLSAYQPVIYERYGTSGNREIVLIMIIPKTMRKPKG